MTPRSPQVNVLPGGVSPPFPSGLELDFHENELEIVGIDDVVLDPGLAGDQAAVQFVGWAVDEDQDGVGAEALAL